MPFEDRQVVIKDLSNVIILIIDSDKVLVNGSDKAQVRAMCEWAAELDSQDLLGKFFDKPNGLNPQQIQTCIEEEGWILGAK